MGSWNKVRELFKVHKEGTKSTYYLFQLVEINGKANIDVRVHFDRIDGSTQYTTQGFSVPVSMFPEMADGFKAALDEYLKG